MAACEQVSDGPSRKLTSINSEIRECVQKLNSLLYLRLELDREATSMRDLVVLHKSLTRAKEKMRHDLEAQLASFDVKFGSAPRTYFALMYENLCRQMPSTDPQQWPVAPPFVSVVVPNTRFGKQKLHCFNILGHCSVQMCTKRYYFVPRLRRSSALKELEELSAKLSAAQPLEKELKAKLASNKADRTKLEEAIQKLRSELADPYEMFESVPAYCEFASAARRYFCDRRLARAQGTLPRISAPQIPAPKALMESNCIFKSFEEHHGSKSYCESWATISDDDTAVSHNTPEHNEQQEALFSVFSPIVSSARNVE